MKGNRKVSRKCTFCAAEQMYRNRRKANWWLVLRRASDEEEAWHGVVIVPGCESQTKGEKVGAQAATLIGRRWKRRLRWGSEPKGFGPQITLKDADERHDSEEDRKGMVATRFAGCMVPDRCPVQF